MLVSGAENARLIREKITIAKQYIDLNEEERNALIQKAVNLAADGRGEYYKDF